MVSDRYARHRAIEGFSQDTLAAMRIGVIGAGAIGNEVVKNLVLLGVGSIDLFDFDTVELHNLTRSVLLREADVGRSKAEAVAARAADLDPNVRVTAFDGDFWHTLPIDRLAGYATLIVAVDNFDARIRANQLCRLAGIDWVNAAIDARHASVERFVFAGDGDVDAACYECTLPHSVYARIAARYSCGGLQRAAWHERIVPTTAITASIAGAHAVGAALGLGGAGSTRDSTRLMIDTRHGHSTLARLVRNVDCPGCAAIGPRPRRVPGPPHADALPALVRSLGIDEDNEPLLLSDPLIWHCACARCGPDARTRGLELQPARRHSDRITRCERCGEDAVQVQIRDAFSATELAGRFGARPLPVRHALAGGVLIDFGLGSDTPTGHADPRSAPQNTSGD